MKKTIAVAMLALAALSLAAPSMAHRYERATNDNPFRLLAYAGHPIGLAAEYIVMRPIHWVVSQPHLDIVFGHQPSTKEDGTYFEWTHGDYSPSIAKEREAAKPEAKAKVDDAQM